MLSKSLFFSVFFLFLVGYSFGQEVKDVLYEFNAGNYKKTIRLIDSAQRNTKAYNLTADEKLLLQKVNVAAHINIDSTQKALDLAQDFLQKKPNYQCNTLADIEEFCDFREAFTVTNKLEMSVNIGTNLPFHFVTNEYSIVDTRKNSNKFKLLGGGDNAGGLDLNFAFRYRLLNRINMELDFGNAIYSYQREMFFQNHDLLVTETTNSFYANLMVSYSVLKTKKIYDDFTLRSYLDMGVGYKVNYRYDMSGDFLLFDKDNTTGDEADAENILDDYDLAPLRNRFLHGVNFTQRWTIFFNRFGISLGVSELLNVTRSNEPDSRNDTPQLQNDFFYIDSDFYVIQIIPQIGFHYTLNYHIKR